MIKSIIARPPPKALQFYLKSNFSIPIFFVLYIYMYTYTHTGQNSSHLFPRIILHTPFASLGQIGKSGSQNHEV